MSVNYQWIEDQLKASYLNEELVQDLWSGYGKLKRIFLDNGESIILKEINFPIKQKHPRGWSTSLSDERKRRSYQVEQCWYEALAMRLNQKTKVPRFLGKHEDGEISFLLEDLNTSGFPIRHHDLNMEGVKSVLRWLARFHATFLGVEPTGLWPIGSYWHLDTRPDEFEAMETSWLKENAHKIDELLKTAKYQTIVHGDAKLANFCFSEQMDVAAVDFQYVGGGCGMKDVAYFMSSCLSSEDAFSFESELLDTYFEELKQYISPDIYPELVLEWRELYTLAWADFLRFLKGWAPDHYKFNNYSFIQLERAKDILTF